MDIITHSLAGFLVKRIRPEYTTSLSVTICLFIGALIPDIGEIKIQAALAEKFGEKLAVYDDRTSDIEIASQISITWLYDILHSFPLPLFLYCCAELFVKNTKHKNCIYFLSIGLLTHIFLDSFTHGKVWALKLFFPLSNCRFKIFDDIVGNWWDWSPKFKLPFVQVELPIYCVIIWSAMVLIATLVFYKK
jgi:LexA-binding, inner membrane-associated putative hydrolase